MAAGVDLSQLKNFLECAVCLEQYDNPKLLSCSHHFCKGCLEDIIKFNKDGSALIECPLRCTDKTIIGINETVNDLNTSYDFKNILAALKKQQNPKLEDSSIPTCKYNVDCGEMVSVFCCQNLMCVSCHSKHVNSNRHIPQQEKVNLVVDKNGVALRVLCDEHVCQCTHLCMDDRFLCMYCIRRNAEHSSHSKNEVEREVSLLREAIKNAMAEKGKVARFKEATIQAMESDKVKLDNVLRQRKNSKAKKSVGKINVKLLKSEEDHIRATYNDIYSSHIKQYDIGLSVEYFQALLEKTDVELVLRKNEIIDTIQKNRDRLSLKTEAAFLHDYPDREHPLGTVELVAGLDVLVNGEPSSTFKLEIIKSVETTDVPADTGKLIDYSKWDTMDLSDCSGDECCDREEDKTKILMVDDNVVVVQTSACQLSKKAPQILQHCDDSLRKHNCSKGKCEENAKSGSFFGGPGRTKTICCDKAKAATSTASCQSVSKTKAATSTASCQSVGKAKAATSTASCQSVSKAKAAASTASYQSVGKAKAATSTASCQSVGKTKAATSTASCQSVGKTKAATSTASCQSVGKTKAATSTASCQSVGKTKAATSTASCQSVGKTTSTASSVSKAKAALSNASSTESCQTLSCISVVKASSSSGINESSVATCGGNDSDEDTFDLTPRIRELGNGVQLHGPYRPKDLVAVFDNKASWAADFDANDRHEWIIDCYRMRVDDDFVNNEDYRHGLYETNPKGGQKLAVVKDFLIFMKLSVHNKVLPPANRFSFEECLKKAALLLKDIFDKYDAEKKWGAQNVLSMAPSLRRTAEGVYGKSCMRDAKPKTEGTLELNARIKTEVERGVKKQFHKCDRNVFVDVGGFESWHLLYQTINFRQR